MLTLELSCYAISKDADWLLNFNCDLLDKLENNEKVIWNINMLKWGESLWWCVSWD